MTEPYRDALDAVIPLLLDVLDEFHVEQLKATPFLFDAIVQELLRALGRALTERVAERLGTAAVQTARAEGYRIERSPKVTFWTVFGEVTVRSPYLQSGSSLGGVRPVNDALNVRSSGRTVSLDRAMCDFGLDESFEGAARKLQEHYGLKINRTTLLRTVEKHGDHVLAQSRFAGMEARWAHPVEGPGLPHLVEMDGSSVRTGTLAPKDAGGNTPKRNLPVRTRTTEWRDLRLAFVRRLDGEDATWVGGIDTFDRVIAELVGEACEVGWTPATFTLRVTDGGPGLREALDARFPVGQQVLDKPHLLHHLHETAAEMYDEDDRKSTVAAWNRRISAGEVAAVIRELQSHKGRGKERAAVLAAYLTRFADAVNYDELERLGYPIGSGEIESAHKGHVQRRLKLPGTWWTVAGANSVLALRLLRANGRWDAYWRAPAAA